MSINAISSVSLYEYYYKINKDEQEKKESPLAREMREYGLTPTDNEALNAALLSKAKSLKEQENTQAELPYSARPWADIMYQLNIPFNEDPKDDIEEIKKELSELVRGIDDEELEKEVTDLESHVENLYLGFQSRSVGAFDNSMSLSIQLNNLSMLNQANLL
jgi:hypothetical protein